MSEQQYVTTFLRAIADFDVNAPEVTLDGDGDICFDWFEAVDATLSAWIRPDGQVGWAVLCGSFSQSGTFMLPDLSDGFREALQRIHDYKPALSASGAGEDACDTIYRVNRNELRSPMIERRMAEYILIQCDECANGFSGDYDEPLDDVVAFARSQGWEVSPAPGRTLCPATLLRRRAENPDADYAVDPVGGKGQKDPTRDTVSSSSKSTYQPPQEP